MFVRFEAAAVVADVFLNHQRLGQHRGAFAAFAYELTPQLNGDAPNVLRVRADNTRVADVPQVTLNGVGGAVDGSVRVVGDGGTLLRGDGQRCAAVPLNLAPNVRLLSLFGVGDERWITSTDGLFRYLP